MHDRARGLSIMQTILSAAIILAVALIASSRDTSAKLGPAETTEASETCEINSASHMVGQQQRACNGRNQNNNCFRAAVVDYSPYSDWSGNCSVASDENLRVYEKIARIAGENGAQILVFAENGITVDQPRPCLEEIPDPMLVTDYNPCLQPNRFNEKPFPILTRLSCMARENGLYLVANYGTKQRRCQDGNCTANPATQIKGAFGQYLMLNTDVVFDPTGLFIRRYRKWHPFVPAESYAKAPQLEHVYFDTQFGRFGVFTCFDILFKQPAIDLVEKFNIDTVVFPTAWLDELPMLTAIQIQDGWSSANQVNLLGSNILNPWTGATGSGIFTNRSQLYVTPHSLNQEEQVIKTKILISTIQARNQANTCKANADSKIIELDENPASPLYNAMDYPVQRNDSIEILGTLNGTKQVCASQVCCTADYELDPAFGAKHYLSRIVILVRDGLRLGGWYEQVCTVATLNKPYKAHKLDPASGDASWPLNANGSPLAGFKRLSLRAEFDTKYVFPLGGHDLFQLVERDRRRLNCQPASDNSTKRYACHLQYLPATEDEDGKANRLYSFGMYARVYERDQEELLYEEKLRDYVGNFRLKCLRAKLYYYCEKYVYFAGFGVAIIMLCWLIKKSCCSYDELRQLRNSSHQAEYGTSVITRRDI